MNNVLDASAILALMLREDGHANVTAALADGAAACTVNMSEVVARCIRAEMPTAVVHNLIELLPVTWVEADMDLAFRAGEMIAVTKPFGLSLGDRFCLALAARENVPAVTADAAWLNVAAPLGLQVQVIRQARG